MSYDGIEPEPVNCRHERLRVKESTTDLPYVICSQCGAESTEASRRGRRYRWDPLLEVWSSPFRQWVNQHGVTRATWEAYRQEAWTSERRVEAWEDFRGYERNRIDLVEELPPPFKWDPNKEFEPESAWIGAGWIHGCSAYRGHRFWNHRDIAVCENCGVERPQTRADTGG